MTQLSYFFADDLPADADPKSLLGGKGASLAEMTRAGLNVPPGFTIATDACRFYHDKDGQWPEGLEQAVRADLARLEKAMGRQFGRGARPLLVSVRSGAAVSMPGMMDTILNCGINEALANEVGGTPRFWRVYMQFIESFAKTVAGLTPRMFEETASSREGPASRVTAREYLQIYEANAGKPFPQEPWEILVECINAVFRSWNSERAVAYRKRGNIVGLTGTAVNVQAMFPSQVSGIAFTQDPNNLAAQRIVIESSFGLGEAVVSGDVTPDRFLVSRADFGKYEAFVGKKIGAVEALGDERECDANALTLNAGGIAELCGLCLKVENHFGRPMDIEWGWADGRFALLQCRAIRGLDVVQDAEEGRQEEILRLRESSGGRHRLWVTHNLGETLRAPTPLTWDIVRDFMSGSGGFGMMYRDLGYEPSELVLREGFLDLILGRIYADPERVAQLFWGALPMGYDLDAILRNKSELDRPPTRFHAECVDETFLFKLPGTVRAMFRGSRTMKRLRPRIKDVFENEVLPPYLEYVRAKRQQDLTKFPTAAVLEELADRRRRVLNDFGKESLKPPFFAAMALGDIESTLVQLMGRDEGARYASALTMALENDTTYEQDLMLSEVAAGRAAMGDFIEKYGHRTTNEMELAEPRWREDHSFIDSVVAQMRAGRGKSLKDVHADNVNRYEQARRELPARLAQWGGSSLREEIEGYLNDVRSLLPYREAGKHYLMMGYEAIRLAIVELGRRWELGSDVFYLRFPELERWESRKTELRDEIARRKVRWKSVQRLDTPDVIDSASLDGLGLPPDMPDSGELVGDAVSSGVATGFARIVINPREVGDLGRDYVLVCPSTDPGWTPLFVSARALVIERGGILSHGAIVARDFGIPAVVCPHATSVLKDGEKIRVDGNHGKIVKIEK
jgi:pyruvate,water dikinase